MSPTVLGQAPISSLSPSVLDPLPANDVQQARRAFSSLRGIREFMPTLNRLTQKRSNTGSVRSRSFSSSASFFTASDRKFPLPAASNELVVANASNPAKDPLAETSELNNEAPAYKFAGSSQIASEGKAGFRQKVKAGLGAVSNKVKGVFKRSPKEEGIPNELNPTEKAVGEKTGLNNEPSNPVTAMRAGIPNELNPTEKAVGQKTGLTNEASASKPDIVYLDENGNRISAEEAEAQLATGERTIGHVNLTGISEALAEATSGKKANIAAMVVGLTALLIGSVALVTRKTVEGEELEVEEGQPNAIGPELPHPGDGPREVTEQAIAERKEEIRQEFENLANRLRSSDVSSEELKEITEQLALDKYLGISILTDDEGNRTARCNPEFVNKTVGDELRTQAQLEYTEARAAYEAQQEVKEKAQAYKDETNKLKEAFRDAFKEFQQSPGYTMLASFFIVGGGIAMLGAGARLLGKYRAEQTVEEKGDGKEQPTDPNGPMAAEIATLKAQADHLDEMVSQKQANQRAFL